jgi:uncharacterized protein (TIGR03435 family)
MPNSQCRRSSLLAATLFALTIPFLSAQADPAPSTASQTTVAETKPLAFDVVSIKPNKSGNISGGANFTPNGFSAVNMPLSPFIYRKFPSRLVYGIPAWTQSERYDVEARVAGSDLAAFHNASKAELSDMLQAALEERLKLKSHTETRELPMFTLVAAKSGSKLKAQTEEITTRTPPPNTVNLGGGLYLSTSSGPSTQIIGQGASITRLLDYIAPTPGIDRLIVDKTGMTGKYDFTLSWSPSNNPDSSGLSIFTALPEQLGLKLEPTKGPVQVLVIDHIERPTEN